MLWTRAEQTHSLIRRTGRLSGNLSPQGPENEGHGGDGGRPPTAQARRALSRQLGTLAALPGREASLRPVEERTEHGVTVLFL